INNVGTNDWKPTAKYTSTELSTLLSTNFESAYHFSQLAYPLLKASGHGSIVFVSSVAGVFSINVGSIYGSTKAGAVNQLTKELACEWAKDNIRTNCVAPWFVRTPLTEQVLSSSKFMEAVVSRTPLGRVGEPEEVAHLGFANGVSSPLHDINPRFYKPYHEIIHSRFRVNFCESYLHEDAW
ncbi:hypothetical protein Goshw_025892, partial [Gossypium schwendimanii]|nr:hypothetical protein [Gossypium schwendimanii]